MYTLMYIFIYVHPSSFDPDNSPNLFSLLALVSSASALLHPTFIFPCHNKIFHRIKGTNSPGLHSCGLQFKRQIVHISFSRKIPEQLGKHKDYETDLTDFLF